MKQMVRSLGARVLRGTVIAGGFVGSVYLGFFLAYEFGNSWFLTITLLPLFWLLRRYRRMPYLTFMSLPPRAQTRWVKRRRLKYFGGVVLWASMIFYALLNSGVIFDGVLIALGASFVLLLFIILITALMARVPEKADRLFELDIDDPF